MWTRREIAMLKAMGTQLKSYKSKSGPCHSEEWTLYWVGVTTSLANVIRAAVRAVREVKEPDYKAMWEGARGEFLQCSWGPYKNPGDIMAEIERRHGGKA